MRLARRTLTAILLIALLAGCRRSSEIPATWSGAPVIIISIDTLRADRVGAYGYDAARTPHIDALAREGVLFRNAYTPAPLTLPAHASLLTGALPAQHGVRDNIGYRLEAGSRPTLPGTLRSRGYATGAAVSAYVLRSATGIGPLFDWYDDAIAFESGGELGSLQRRGEATIASAERWISQRGTSPFFLFLHLFEPHAPYEAPEPYRSAAAHPYDAEVSYADALVGSFLDRLRRDGIYDRAVIAVMGDHGEGLGDHGENEHGIFLYRESIHVPLIVKLPGGARSGHTVDDTVSLLDVFPTVMALLGEPIPAQLAGLPLLGPVPLPEGRRVFSETLYPRLHLGWSDLRSLVDTEHHYIEAPRAELYVLRDDPRETRNAIEEQRRAAASFRTQLAGVNRNLVAPAAVSEEEAAKLAALGYVSAPAASGSEQLPDPKDVIGQFNEFESAKNELARGDAPAAIARLSSVLAQNPRFTDAAITLARAYEAAGMFEQAAETYRGVLRQNPALTEQVAIGVATAYLNAGRLGDAREHAELALRSNPAGAHLLLGRIALAARDAEGAARYAREAMRDPHYDAQAVLLLVDALLAGGSGGENAALAALDDVRAARARRGAPPARGLHVARARVLMRSGRAEEAAQALRAEIREHPRDRDAYARLAAIHLLQKDVAGAERVFEEMVRAVPDPASYRLASETLAHFGARAQAEVWRGKGAAR